MEKILELKEYILSKKYLILILVLLVVIATGISIWWFLLKDEIQNKDNPKEVLEEIEIVDKNKEEEFETNTEEVVTEIAEPVKEEYVLVDIKGEVKKPGLYEVNKKNRVQDVINLAGGTTNNADTSTINLSKKVFDEMVIIVYAKKIEPIESPSTSNNTNKNDTPKQEIINNIKDCPTQTEIKNDACIKEEDLNNKETTNQVENVEEVSDIISINTATKEMLMTLPGIGESKADKIIEYRNQVGLFETIEDIKQISGIGDSIFEKIKPYITL